MCESSSPDRAKWCLLMEIVDMLLCACFCVNELADKMEQIMCCYYKRRPLGDYAAIWRKPGQTTRPSGASQAKLSGHLAQARPNYAAIWRKPGQTTRPSGACQAIFKKCCHESLPAAPAQGTTREGCPAIWQQPKIVTLRGHLAHARPTIAAIWHMPGHTTRQSAKAGPTSIASKRLCPKVCAGVRASIH